MGSTRLPGKVLRKIGKEPLLAHILCRLKQLKHQADVVVATTNLNQDDCIEEYCQNIGVSCFRGSEKNVLQRYYLCAVENGFDHIVRLTADNPFTDIDELGGLIQMHLDTEADFSHSFASLPVGVGAEVFTFQTLKQSYEQGHDAHHIEHVDEYMLEHPELFNTCVYQAPASKCYPGIRLTVDTLDDYQRVCAIVDAQESDPVSIEEIIRFCLHSA